jgi:AcrR family transcriptional regulator
MNANNGLRERKKNQTKQALINSAYNLFKKQGYSKTSIYDISRDANFAPRTFFLHFNSKEDLLFPDDHMLVNSLNTALAERSPGVTSLQAIRFWIMAVVYQKEAGNSSANVLRRKVINSDKSLQARQRLNLSEVEDILAKAIAYDLKARTDQIKPRIVAAAAVAIFGMIDQNFRYELQAEESQKSIDMAITFLESGLAGLRNKGI